MVRRKEKEHLRTKTDLRSSRNPQEASSKKLSLTELNRDQPVSSLGFLQCAENFEINDGSIASIGRDSFNARRDMHVTINISPASSSCSSANTPFDNGDQNKRELRVSQPELPEETSMTSTSSSAQSSRNTSSSRHEVEEHPMLPPLQRSCDTYRRNLVTKGRGIPLWIPEPNKKLSLQYQRQGVSVGDVGIVTASGSFMFLFDIYLAKGHPINPPVMPEGFEPMRRREITELPTDYNTCLQKEFKKNSYLASDLSVKTRKDGEFTRLFFESSKRDGAILTMPDGASSEDLVNTARLWKYANKNLKSWYQYAYHDREIDVKNGDLKVVSGCDKTSSWGMAAFFNSGVGFDPGSSLNPRSHSDSVTGGGEPKVHLEFGLIGNRDDCTGEGRTKIYGWEHSGLADVRSGPDDCELLELRGGEVEEEGVVYVNQCLFVRTLNLTFPMKVWEGLGLGEEEEEEEEEDGTHENSTSRDGRNCASPPSSSSGGAISAATFSSSSASKGHISTRSSTHKEEIIVNEHNAEPIYSPLMSLTDHPSIAINDFLLKNCSNDITMAITLDQDWMSVLKEDDFVLPSSEKLLARIMDAYTIREEDGVVFLHSKCVVEGQNGSFNCSIPNSVDARNIGQIIDRSSPYPGLRPPKTFEYLRLMTLLSLYDLLPHSITNPPNGAVPLTLKEAIGPDAVRRCLEVMNNGPLSSVAAQLSEILRTSAPKSRNNKSSHGQGAGSGQGHSGSADHGTYPTSNAQNHDMR